MKDFLLEQLRDKFPEFKKHEDLHNFQYVENVNEDADSDTWLEKGTSFIHTIGILAAVDSNKLDWAYFAIGQKRMSHSKPILIGFLEFPQGENDDITRTIKRINKIFKHTFDF